MAKNLNLVRTFEDLDTVYGVAEKQAKALGVEKKISSYLTNLPLLLFSLMAHGLLWQQSLAIYRSIGFSHSEMVAAGALLMVFGFSAYYAATKTWLGFILCLYISAYEGYFVISGTFEDDRHQKSALTKEDPEVVLLQEKAELAKENYLASKDRYLNSQSKVYQNQWFKQNHLDPAWGAFDEAQKIFIEKSNQTLAAALGVHATLLKVFYRLGLVLLCMISVHHLAVNLMRA